MIAKKLPFTPAALFVAANRLPLSASRENESERWELKESPGGLVSALKSVDLKMKWIGWLGNEIPHELQSEMRSLLNLQSDQIDLHPVFLTDFDRENFYNGFANQMIWPNFHDLSHLMHYSEDQWKSYQEVNFKFAQQILWSVFRHSKKHPEQEIMVWIHDYQLMLVPRFLRSLLSQKENIFKKNIKIAFFLHIPFPSYDIFKTFPVDVRKILIEGLLSSDLLGVHEQSYLDNFIENISAHENWVHTIFERPRVIRSGHHRTHVGVYPIGIQPEIFEKIRKEKKISSKVKKILNPNRDMKIILGVDRLDPSKGLLEKLEGYACFLETNPEFVDKTVLLQIAVPSRTEIEEYKILKTELFTLAQKINERFRTSRNRKPVQLIYENFGVEDLTAFYRAGDVLLVTSAKDGMNLVSFEYSVCQEDRTPDYGVVILSKHAGAARYLHGSMTIDPFDKADTAKTIREALTMSTKERESRLFANLGYIKKNTAKNWADEFISDLKKLAENDAK
jgi:alpha,alpha-trehalose-phosphate synthase [UDP-forming]